MRYSFKSLTAAMVICLGLSSCLKDTGKEDGTAGFEPDNSKKVVEIAGAPAGTAVKNTAFVVNLEFSDKDTVAGIVRVRLAAEQPAPEDIQVTLAANSTLVNDYNTDQGTAYVVPPTSIYTVPSLVVTIPKGSREGELKITTKPSVIAQGTYAFGFTISSVSGTGYMVSGNFNNIVVIVGVKNRFDGVYNLRCRMGPVGDRPTVNVSNAWTWGGHVQMITASATANKLFDDYGFHAYIQPIHTNADVESGFGQTQPKFEFDLATNKLISVTNDSPLPITNGRAFKINSSITTSRYDPSSHNIYAAFYMTQPGFADLPIYDTLLYVGPR